MRAHRVDNEAAGAAESVAAMEKAAELNAFTPMIGMVSFGVACLMIMLLIARWGIKQNKKSKCQKPKKDDGVLTIIYK